MLKQLGLQPPNAGDGIEVPLPGLILAQPQAAVVSVQRQALEE